MQTSLSEHLFQPSINHRLKIEEINAENYIDRMARRIEVAGPAEIEQHMRRELLVICRDQIDEADELRVYDKYARMARQTYDGSGYRVDPFDEAPKMWERAKTWVMERLSQDTWIREAEAGGLHHFVSERAQGLQTALTELGIVIRYNTRSHTAEVLDGSGEWIEVTDQIEALIRDTIAKLFHFVRAGRAKDKPKAVPAAWSASAWNVCFNAFLANHNADPFRDWLDSLPSWDGTARLDNWLDDAGLRIEPGFNPELRVWASASIPMVACIRTIEPGTKHDTIPVLIGPQECGKSTAISNLVPASFRQKWFSDELNFSRDERKRVEALQGAVLVEVSEMTGATTAELESMKAFLSRTTDRLRLAYRRNPEPLPRRVSIVGTANGNAILPNDPTGNRRFLAIPIIGGNPKTIATWLDDNRDQLWAEAWTRTNAGETIWFKPELARAQQSVNDRFRSSDDLFEDAITKWIVERLEKKMPDFSTADVVDGLGIVDRGRAATAASPADQHRIKRVLVRLGCSQRRVRNINGQYIRVWSAPENLSQNLDHHDQVNHSNGLDH